LKIASNIFMASIILLFGELFALKSMIEAACVKKGSVPTT